MKLEDFEIIAFDLDGTLAESKLPLDNEMANLLCDLVSKKKVAVASGASLGQFQKQFLANFLYNNKNDLKNLYLIPTNGASMYFYEDEWKPLYKIEFTQEESSYIFEAFEKALKDGGYEKPDKIYGPLIEDRGSQITFSGCGNDAPISIKKDWDPDHKKREKIVSFLTPLLKDCSISMGGTTSIDITKKGIDKNYGLVKLLEYLNMPKEKLIYVGDALFPGGNDSVVLKLGVRCIPVLNVEKTKELLNDLLLEID
jgi:phosphomannomutase